MDDTLSRREKMRRRLDRQFDALAVGVPAAARPIRYLRRRRLALLRMPLGLLLVAGGIFSFLPVLGVWMLPLGLMLLAIDLPVLQPFITSAVIRVRRRISATRRRLRRRLPKDGRSR